MSGRTGCPLPGVKDINCSDKELLIKAKEIINNTDPIKLFGAKLMK